ncbi:MAG: hypothetical protein EZS28_042298 [Streblomastix strix]|uniref:Uncharacterized protein n=1 Tax=Streblomastix strix TaxID=222440 RepID=A0A5J4TUK6_9EUKA|nr:MAG: hypothetical protein EZS28_042298 [Streblomastix strix]
MYVIRLGIVDSLLQILITHNINSITIQFCSAFFYLSIFLPKQLENQILIKKANPALISIFIHGDVEVEIIAIASIHNRITECIEDTEKDKLYQLFDEIQGCNDVSKIYEVFIRNMNKHTRDFCLVCIGYLYRSREIRDQKMRSDIIQNLKLLTDDSDNQSKTWYIICYKSSIVESSQSFRDSQKRSSQTDQKMLEKRIKWKLGRKIK